MKLWELNFSYIWVWKLFRINTETLRKDISQRILRINKHATLEKVLQLLDSEEIVGYTAEGNEISEIDYVSDINESLQRLKNGTLETFSSDDVRRNILGKWLFFGAKKRTMN